MSIDSIEAFENLINGTLYEIENNDQLELYYQMKLAGITESLAILGYSWEDTIYGAMIH